MDGAAEPDLNAFWTLPSLTAEWALDRCGGQASYLEVILTVSQTWCDDATKGFSSLDPLVAALQ